jgi:hypothetical protein
VSRIKTFKNFKTFDIRSRNQTPNICAEMANSQLARWPMEAINQVRLLFPTKPRLNFIFLVNTVACAVTGWLVLMHTMGTISFQGVRM